MGVMGCHISDCESIMCDTYMSEVGYVCEDCQDRFKGWMLTQPDTKYLESKAYLIDKLVEFNKIEVIPLREDSELLDRIDAFFRKSI